MKNIRIFVTLVLVSLVSVAFAQRKQDSVEVNKPKKERNANNSMPIERKSSFGYHHNNYKQHVKAEKSRQWFRSSGHVNRTAKVTNYKMPFTEDQKVEKTTVETTKSTKRSRNYKRPYSN